MENLKRGPTQIQGKSGRQEELETTISPSFSFQSFLTSLIQQYTLIVVTSVVNYTLNQLITILMEGNKHQLSKQASAALACHFSVGYLDTKSAHNPIRVS